jgi:hypothetical protein
VNTSGIEDVSIVKPRLGAGPFTAPGKDPTAAVESFVCDLRIESLIKGVFCAIIDAAISFASSASDSFMKLVSTLAYKIRKKTAEVKTYIRTGSR